MKLNPYIVIKPEVCFSAIFVLLFLPLPVAAGWYLAVIIHETSHFLALRLCGCDVTHISIGSAGVTMVSDLDGGWKELICSFAGPMGSLILLLFARVLPYFALCGLIQFLFNMIPLYPLDGGRICYCLIKFILPYHKAYDIFSIFQNFAKIVLICISLFLAFACKLGAMPIVLVVFLLLRYRRISP